MRVALNLVLLRWLHLTIQGVGYAKLAPGQLNAVTEFVRNEFRDVARLAWLGLRGHGRWIAKAWIWVTHGDLRADARARWAKLGIALPRITLGWC